MINLAPRAQSQQEKQRQRQVDDQRDHRRLRAPGAEDLAQQPGNVIAPRLPPIISHEVTRLLSCSRRPASATVLGKMGASASPKTMVPAHAASRCETTRKQARPASAKRR
jgi:hypothetical protein